MWKNKEQQHNDNLKNFTGSYKPYKEILSLPSVNTAWVTVASVILKPSINSIVSTLLLQCSRTCRLMRPCDSMHGMQRKAFCRMDGHKSECRPQQQYGGRKNHKLNVLEYLQIRDDH